MIPGLPLTGSSSRSSFSGYGDGGSLSGRWMTNHHSIILLGLRHPAASLPPSPSAGAAIGAGTILGPSSSGTSRNPPTSNPSTRRTMQG